MSTIVNEKAQNGTNFLNKQRMEMVVVICARILNVGCQVSILKIYTLFLSTKELGYFYFLGTISYFLNALLFVPLDYYQQSRLYPLKHEGRSLWSFVVLNKQIFATVLLFSILAIFVTLGFSKKYAVSIFITVTYAILLYATNLIRGLLNNLEHRTVVSLMLVAEGITRILIVYTCLHLFGKNAFTAFSSGTIALLISVIALIIVSSKYNLWQREHAVSTNWKEIFKFSYPLSLSSIIYWLQLQSYRLIFVPLGFASSVGTLSAICNIGQQGTAAISQIYSQIYTPFLYKTNGKYLKQYIRKAVFLIAIIILGAILFAKPAVHLLTNNSLAQFAYLLLIGVIIEGGNLLCNAFSIFLTIKNKATLIFLPSAIGFLVMATGCFIVYFNKLSSSPFALGIPLAFSQIAVILVFALLVLKTSRHIHFNEKTNLTIA